jgi:hypothetical protein
MLNFCFEQTQMPSWGRRPETKSAGRNFLPALERRWDSTRPLEDLANKVYPLPGKTL